MQRYRVNYRLLIGLVVGFLVLAPATYFWWRYQINQNADRLIAKADAAEASGNIEEAFESLAQYARLRSKEKQAWRRLGSVAVKIAEDEKLDMELRGHAFQTVTLAVREIDALNQADREGNASPEPEDSKLRRQLVDVQMKFGLADVALINIEQLLADGSEDAELKSLKAQCLFATKKQAAAEKWCNELIGYDPKTKAFAPVEGSAPTKPVVYALLASNVYERDQDLADRIIEQMLKANPDSVDAYVMKYQLLNGQKRSDEARTALEKAFELEPDNDMVLNAKGIEAYADYQKAQVALAALEDKEGEEAKKLKEEGDKHLADAAEIFAKGMEEYPERIDFYERAARLELFRGEQDKAMAIVDQGIAAFPLKTKLDRLGFPAAIGLANIKAESLLGEKDFDGVKKVIAELRALKNARVDAVADFHEARLDAVNEKWADAAAKLKAVRPQLIGFPDLQALAAAIQGFCQTQMGQFDLALDAYKQALEINPDLMQAKVGKEQMLAMTNQAPPDEQMFALDREIKTMLALPKAKQDWTALGVQLDKYIDEEAAKRPVAKTWAPSRKALLKGQMLAMRAAEEKDPAEQKRLFQLAREEIKKAYSIDPKDPTVQMQAVRLLAQEPDSGPAKALELLDSIVKKGEDSANFRTLRVDLLFTMKGDNLPAQLEAATQGMESFPENQQALVWSAVATRYEQLGMFNDARRCLEQAVALAPTSLPLRTALFDLAMRQSDDPGMRAAQEKILEIVKSKSDPTYVLTEVKRRISGFNNGSVAKEELVEARQMLEAAIKQRQGWAELLVAKGQLALLVDNNVDEALTNFEKAFALGASNLNALSVQVKLLADRGRLQEARDRMNRIPSISWTAALGNTAADVLAASGDLDAAVIEAQKVAEMRPEDPQTQTWLSDIAVRAKKNDVAETAMKKAIALNPEDPDAWTRLVSLYLQQKRPNDVERTLREAFLALDDEYLPLLTGKYYELQSRWQEAEDIYIAAYADQLDDPNISRRLAEFYLQWASAHPDNASKAAVYLNKLLRASYEGKLPADNPTAAWARRQAAKLLAQTGDFQNSQKAERLLAAAAANAANREDQDQLVDLLSLRPDPISRERAIEALRTSKQVRGSLTPERELQLADLLNRNGDWEAAQELMLNTIGRFPNDLRLQTAFASMLIERKDFDEAALRISLLEGKPDLAASVAELRLRLAAKRGDSAEVRRMLTSMTPNFSKMTEEQLKYLRQLAQTADSLGDHEYALTLLQEYSRRASDAAMEIARLKALHGNLDEGFAELQGLAPNDLEAAARVAVEVLRERRSDNPEKLDELASRFVRAALRDDPESARRLVLEAEMLEVQEKYDESVAAYKKLLARDDAPGLIRATALNNLAFILAARSQSPADLELALNSVNEAIELIGPLADILDTRALTYIAQQQYQPAVEDMKLAIKVSPTASKYYHHAAALLGAGDQEGALAAWKKAKAEKVGPETVAKLEQPSLAAFTEKIEQIAAPGATAGIQ